MAYSELIKNFERVRDYMRQFYIYGFKSRTEYDGRSARSYDDERRRIESWLGEYMRFQQNPEGKTVFLSVDSRRAVHNPLYKAWKAKSFTDRDITLHFLILDLLSQPDSCLTLAQITQALDEYLSQTQTQMSFDESTVRKKLKEYRELGLLQMEKRGRLACYSRTPVQKIDGLVDALDFFSEMAPCGVIGSYLLDTLPPHQAVFSFKHHGLTGALDEGVLAQLLDAIHDRCYITADNLGHRMQHPKTVRLVPLRIDISTQSGRQNLIAYHPGANRLNSYRLDYLSHVCRQEPCSRFEELRQALQAVEGYQWGVNCQWSPERLEHVEFEIRIGKGEGYVLDRLQREKRSGLVEQLDGEHWQFCAEVFDTWELIPWIRTFLCRITRLTFSNRTVENRFRQDLEQMYRMYGLDKEEIL